MRFVVEPGAFGLGAGASALDIRAEAVAELTGPVTEYTQRGVVATAVTIENAPGPEGPQEPPGSAPHHERARSGEAHAR